MCNIHVVPLYPRPEYSSRHGVPTMQCRYNNGIANCETNHHCYETRLQEMAIFLLEFLDYALFFSKILAPNKVALASSIMHFRVDVQKNSNQYLLLQGQCQP